MKILIDDPISTTLCYNQSLEEIKDIFDENYLSILKEYTIFYNIDYDFRDELTTVNFSIKQQKCTLDEFAVNDFMANVIYEFWDPNEIKIEYAHLGGKGCDFSFRLSKV